MDALTLLYYIAVFCNAIITLSSGKFKRYCYAKCGRVVKTRVSGGKIRQDIKTENQERTEVQVSRCNKVKLIQCVHLSSDTISSLMK